MTNIRFQMDVTGTSRSELAEMFSRFLAGHKRTQRPDDKMNLSYRFEKEGCDVWELVPTNKVFGQKKAGNGGYIIGGDDYCTKIISPPFSIIKPDTIAELTMFLRQEGVLINKSCRFKLAVEHSDLTAKQVANIVCEVVRIEMYVTKIFGEGSKFEPMDIHALEEQMKSDVGKITEFLQAHQAGTGIYTDGSTLYLDYLKAAMDQDKTDCLVSFCALMLKLTQKAVERKSMAKVGYLPDDNEKYRFRTSYILPLKMMGADYARTRDVLMKHLTGDAGWLIPKKKTNTTEEKEPLTV